MSDAASRDVSTRRLPVLRQQPESHVRRSCLSPAAEAIPAIRQGNVGEWTPSEVFDHLSREPVERRRTTSTPCRSRFRDPRSVQGGLFAREDSLSRRGRLAGSGWRRTQGISVHDTAQFFQNAVNTGTARIIVPNCRASSAQARPTHRHHIDLHHRCRDRGVPRPQRHPLDHWPRHVRHRRSPGHLGLPGSGRARDRAHPRRRPGHHRPPHLDP